MVIIYFLAVIGGICVLGMAFLAIGIFSEFKRDAGQDAEEPEITCALTGEHCIFTVERSACIGCPIAEEAERRRGKS